MILFSGIWLAISAGLTQVLSVIEQIAPVALRIANIATSGQKNEAEVHPSCQVPICGQWPNYCPEHQLTPECRQRRMQIANTVSLLRTTMAFNLKDDDTTEKASSSTSSHSTMMLVLVAVIGLAIAGFVYMRFKQGNNNKNNDRRSSTWSV